MKKNVFVTLALIAGTIGANAQLQENALSLFGENPISSVNGFRNKIEFTGTPHAAIVFKPGEKEELMFGMHDNGNFYWGTGKNSSRPNYYAMYLKAKTGDLYVPGNMGIGVSVPEAKLHVKGNIRLYYSDKTKNINILGGKSGNFIDSYNNDLYLRADASNRRSIILKKDGNVGIGALKPKAKLEINGGARIAGSNSVPSVNGFVNKLEFTGTPHAAIVFKPGEKEELMFGMHDNGNFYWGTGRNATKKDFYSMNLNGRTGSLTLRGGIKTTKLNVDNPNSDYSFISLGHDGNDAIISDNKVDSNHYGGGYWFRVHDESLSHKYRDVMSLNQNGNVGIGILKPKNKLSVNGTIWAKEIKVSLTDAADWVFEENYKLRSLVDVENFIKKNKHLPEIPSADEFRKEDLKVSEITNKLLQKIEELTLYTIEQEKKIQTQKVKDNTQMNLIKSLGERMKRLEELILSKKN